MQKALFEGKSGLDLLCPAKHFIIILNCHTEFSPIGLCRIAYNDSILFRKIIDYRASSATATTIRTTKSAVIDSNFLCLYINHNINFNDKT